MEPVLNRAIWIANNGTAFRTTPKLYYKTCSEVIQHFYIHNIKFYWFNYYITVFTGPYKSVQPEASFYDLMGTLLIYGLCMTYCRSLIAFKIHMKHFPDLKSFRNHYKSIEDKFSHIFSSIKELFFSTGYQSMLNVFYNWSWKNK